MKILFITEDHSKNNYGITTVLSQLISELMEYDSTIQPFLVSTSTETVACKKNFYTKLIPPSKILAGWRWSPFLLHHIEQIVNDQQIDLIHINGLWMAAQWAGLRVAKKRNLPCIISSHGMLESWFWERSSKSKNLKKSIYFKSMITPNLPKTTIVHAITPLEQENLRKWFPQQKSVIIPNAIKVDPYHTETIPQKYFLFIGRLHPKKGVDLFIQAFHNAHLDKEWKLILAGPKEVPAYVDLLKQMIQNLGLSDQVQMIGPVFSAEKEALIQNAWVMVVPSYSEVIGMVNLEAAVNFVPSITTFETGLLDWATGGGELIHPNVDELTAKISESAAWSNEERIERGKRSRQLVLEKYSWNVVLPLWKNTYQSMVFDNTNQAKKGLN
jgi:glycosyltransferase involved in cell wall biosynthesis